MRKLGGIFGFQRKKLSSLEAQSTMLMVDIEVQIDIIKELLISTKYIEYSIFDIINTNNNLLIKDINTNMKKLKRTTNYQEIRNVSSSLKSLCSSFEADVIAHNNRIIDHMMADGYKHVRYVENKELDEQQIIAITKEGSNQLVLAGAGTGKTTTIIGKVKYLLSKNICTEEQILVLSFTNASTLEMKNRLEKETGRNIEAITFHKLGLDIITEVEGRVPKISNLSLRNFLSHKIYDLMKDRNYLYKLVSYLLYHGYPAKTEFDFDNEQDYLDYLEYNQPTTLLKEKVKSYGELDIANFLVQHGIKYRYEAPYKIDTRTKDYGEYKPDFYLPDYNIYIEYFGINRNKQVPAYFRGERGRSASEIYNETIEWKRKLHKDNGSILLECYAYEKFENTLIPSLEEKLREQEVLFRPITSEDLLEQLNSNGNSVINGFVELVETIINLLKINKYDIDTIRKKAFSKSVLTLIDLIEPLFDAYTSHLIINDEIDFNDMINIATEYVEAGKYRHQYAYVIIDEYQDISKSRYLLLHAMRKSKHYHLFCVGDDWQSIYRFAGSDVDFILNFETYWGDSAFSRIETTYRFSQDLIDISSSFIMNNPSQARKQMISKQLTRTFPLGEIKGYTENNLANFLYQRLLELPKDSNVLLIGRYAFDIDFIRKNPNFSSEFNNVNQSPKIFVKGRKDLNVDYLTVHRSKGLQADYVYKLNNKNSTMGFPSKIQDHPILDLLLENVDSYLYAEERRLFYVALTRAKAKTTMLTLLGRESQFVLELRRRYGKELESEAFTCPQCGGRLFKKVGRYGEFLGCSNFSKVGCKFTRNIKSN